MRLGARKCQLPYCFPQTFIMDMDSFGEPLSFVMKCELSHRIVAPPAQKYFGGSEFLIQSSYPSCFVAAYGG